MTRQRRSLMGVTAALAALVAASLAGSGGATADSRSEGLEEVAAVVVPQASHFDWFTREVDGETRVIAMVGSRDSSSKPLLGNGETYIDYDNAAGGLNLIDVTDAENPEFLVSVWCPTGNNDVAYIDVQHTINDIDYDGFVAIASNESNGCAAQNGLPSRGAVSLIGLRAQPAEGQSITVDWLRSPFLNHDNNLRFSWANRSPAAHTIVAHPTEPIIYVGNQMLATRTPSVEVLDLSVWPPRGRSHLIGIAVDDTRSVPTALFVGPHDITFAPDGKRAYVSAIDASYIWDTEGDKVFAPELISTLVSPNLKIHHEAVLHPNGRHLLVVDEFVATSNENIPLCPGGGLHVFDLGPKLDDGTHAFERTPVPVGQFYADELGTLVPFGVGAYVDQSGPSASVDLRFSCTAHEFDIPPSGEWMPLAWFGAGVRLLDLSMLADPSVVESLIPTPIVITETGYFVAEGTDVWAAKQHPLVPGYVFATDTDTGLFRVLKRT